MNLRCSDWFYKLPTKRSSTVLSSTVVQRHWGLCDKDDDLRASYELLNFGQPKIIRNAYINRMIWLCKCVESGFPPKPSLVIGY